MNRTPSVIAATRPPKQGENRLQTVSEKEKADAMLQDALGRWLAEYQNNRAIQLLWALHELHRETDGNTQGATNVELFERLAQRWPSMWTDTDPDNIRKTIRSAWKKACEHWESRHRGLKERLEDAGLTIQPEIGNNPGGGRSNPTRYWLHWNETNRGNDTAEIGAATEIPNGGLRYFTDELHEVKGWRWLADGILLSGRAGRLLVGSILVGLFGILSVAALLALGMAIQPSNLSLLYPLLVTLVVAWLFWHPVQRLVEDRIIIAPWWLQPLRGLDDRLLELRSDTAGHGNHLQLTRYTGTCPRCGAAVEIAKGRGELRGRIVGRCRQVPTEHVYSFDPVLRIGRPLR